MNSQEVTIEQRGAGAWILLHRHNALNALSFSMLEIINSALDRFAEDTTVRFLVIDSLSPKAFCAGGDIRAAYTHRKNLDYVHAYFDLEYGLNLKISRFPKPYISLIDGLCFGGGMGLSIHGSHRIISPKAQMAMPETAIGFFPDVGAGYFLNRCPNQIGYYLGITGAWFHGKDAVFLKLATHLIAHESFSSLRTFLAELHGPHVRHQIDLWLTGHLVPSDPGPLETHRGKLASCFNFKTVEEILQALKNHEGEAFLQETLDLLALRSSLSLKVTLSYLSTCQGKSLEDVLKLDRYLASRFCEEDEFYEGIRAMVVDKDKAPSWNLKKLGDVTDEMVQSYFP